jgi:hypothetical protein
LVWPFLDVSTISYGFYNLADLNRGGSDFLRIGPWKVLNRCNWVLGRAIQETRSVPIKFWRGGSPAARVKWGKKFRDSRRSRVWPVLGKRRAEAVYRRRTGAGGGGPRDVVGVPVTGVLEGGRKVARELPRDNVVLMVCLAGAKRWWIDGTTARPSGGGSSSSPA